MSRLTPTQLGTVCALGAVLVFSANDVTIKFLSGDYALHQVVLIRSVIGLAVILSFIVPLTDGRRVFHTRRLRVHLLRGLCVVMANMTFFLGLAAMPLADAVAIFFVNPLIITVFSVVFLGDQVGPRRWAATAIGFVGILIVMRPGSGAFQIASLLPLTSAVFYAGLHILTRWIGKTESAATMAVYIQITFIGVCLLMGLAVGDGRFGGQADPSLDFLLRAWVWPPAADLPFFIQIGFGIGVAGFLISQAYRVAEPAVIAPLEYLALPLSIVWGIAVFGEYPDALALAGIALILGAGLFILWRESQTRPVVASPRLRR